MKPVVAILTSAIAVASQPAYAQFGAGASWNDSGYSAKRSVNQSEARHAVQDGRALPSHVIRERLAKRYGGELNDADMYLESGQYFYNVKWTTGRGERLRLVVDARTARVVSEGR